MYSRATTERLYLSSFAFAEKTKIFWFLSVFCVQHYFILDVVPLSLCVVRGKDFSVGNVSFRSGGAVRLLLSSSITMSADAEGDDMMCCAACGIMSIVEEAAMMCCASCGTAGVDDIKLKDCSACKLVKYCGVKSQKDHRPQHKKECKKRAAELRDEMLFKQPESSYLGDCPICCLPLPLDPTKSILMACCCKLICDGCHVANQMREMKEVGEEVSVLPASITRIGRRGRPN